MLVETDDLASKMNVVTACRLSEQAVQLRPRHQQKRMVRDAGAGAAVALPGCIVKPCLHGCADRSDARAQTQLIEHCQGVAPQSDRRTGGADLRSLLADLNVCS